MARRVSIGAILMVAVFGVCAAWVSSASMAAPIAGADATAAPEANTPPPEVIEAGNLFSTGDFDGATKLLREAVKKNSDLPPAQVITARMFMQMNMPAQARGRLERAVVEDRDDPTAYMMLGDFALHEGRIAEAELSFEKVRSLLPKFEKSAKQKEELEQGLCSGLASVGEARENWAEARKQLEALLKLDPTNAMAMQRLARCLVQQGKPTEALGMLQQAAKHDAEMLTPEAVLARMCEQAGDRENAKKYIARSLLVAPKNVKTRLVAARWAFDTGQLEEALAQTNTALKLDDKSLEAKVLRGMIAAFQKDYRTAERFSEEAHLQAPESFVANNNLALALIEQKDDAKRRRASQYAWDNVQKYPKSPEALSTYGWVQYKLGKLDEAEGALCAAIQGAGFNPDTAYYLARVNVDRNREVEARALLKGAIEEPGIFAMRQEAKGLLDQLNRAQLNKSQPMKEPIAKGAPMLEPLGKQPPAKESVPPTKDAAPKK